MHSALEKRALGFAAAQTLSFHDENAPYYETYMQAIDAVDQGNVPDNCVIFQPFENLDWNDVINHIANENDALLSQFRAVLEEAKTGIVKSAIDCSLDSDMTVLCMQTMVEKGIELDCYILSDQPMTCDKCGARTSFEVVPDGTQEHECLNPGCGYKFIATEEID